MLLYTSKCSVIWQSACLPTPVHAVVYIQVQCYLTVRLFAHTCTCCCIHPSAVLSDSPPVCPHLYMLLYTSKCSVIWQSACLPTPVHAVVYIQVQCYLTVRLFAHTCTCCCIHPSAVLSDSPPVCPHLYMLLYTSKCSVIWQSACLPTPVHAVVYIQVQLPDTPAISAHLYMLLYIQVQLPDTPAISAHLYMLLYIQVQCYLPHWLFPHTCTCCCKYKCSVIWRSACLPTPVHAVVNTSAVSSDSPPVCPHLYMLLYTSKCSVIWQSACLPTPVHAVVNTSAVSSDSPPVCPHLYMLLYTSKCSVIWQSACLPTPVHAVVYIQVQCYLTVRLFAHTCTCCCKYKCSVIWQSACLPTPVHAVVYIQVQCYLTVRLFAHTCTCCCIHPSAVLSDGPPVCPHLYMLL